MLPAKPALKRESLTKQEPYELLLQIMRHGEYKKIILNSKKGNGTKLFLPSVSLVLYVS